MDKIWKSGEAVHRRSSWNNEVWDSLPTMSMYLSACLKIYFFTLRFLLFIMVFVYLSIYIYLFMPKVLHLYFCSIILMAVYIWLKVAAEKKTKFEATESFTFISMKMTRLHHRQVKINCSTSNITKLIRKATWK